jgi:asparagine synthetase B (glutamine-hydrolysing)
MSAIAGILSATTEDLRLIGPMGDQLAHRGPDGDGWMWQAEDGKITAQHDALPDARPMPARAALGHRRRTGESAQPLTESSGRYWISMDADLADPRQNAETVLAAFREKGTACFAELNGAFAIAIYDTELRALTLARDRFGIKPLYSWLYRNHFAFASEIKALFVLPEVRPKLERNMLGDFILGNPSEGPKRFFSNILEFPPAHAATISVDAPVLKPEPYWQAPATQDIADADAIARFRELFDAAMQRHMTGNPGITLTGSIRSTAIAIAMHQAMPKEKPLYSFTAVFDEPELDERTWLTLANGSAHSVTNWLTPLSGDLMLELDNLLWHQDEPFADPTVYAQWCVMRAAEAAKINALLDGFGTDELFGAPQRTRQRFFWQRNTAEAATLKRLIRQAPPPHEPARAALREGLRTADRSGACFNIAPRLPFLDNELTDFCLSLPPALKPDFLARAFADTVPEPIITRPVHPGFRVPLPQWMVHSILPAFMQDSKRTRLPLVPMVDGGRLRELITQQADKPHVALAPLLFRLFIANRWLLRFNVAQGL